MSHVSRQHLSLHLRWIRFHIFTLCLDIIKCFSPWHIWVAWIWLVILLAYEFLFYFFEFTITRPILCLCTLLVPANITICYLSKIADKVSWALIVTGNTRVISLKSRKLVMPHSWYHWLIRIYCFDFACDTLSFLVDCTKQFMLFWPWWYSRLHLTIVLHLFHKLASWIQLSEINLFWTCFFVFDFLIVTTENSRTRVVLWVFFHELWRIYPTSIRCIL